MERVRVLGSPVDVADMDEALAFVGKSLQEKAMGKYILAVNPEKVFALKQNPFLLDMFEKAALLVPDGIGIVKAIRLLHKKKVKRVAGADLMQKICEQAATARHTVFLYGGSEDVNKKAVEVLLKRYPGLKIAGRSNGYVTPEDMATLIRKINESGSDILFIGLGSPKQEQWIAENLPKLQVKICQGIGGTLDTIAGTVKRAPVVFQKMGLEWLYRLINEPHRFRRQLALPKFALLVLKERFKKQ